jgi:hypothetical protein
MQEIPQRFSRPFESRDSTTERLSRASSKQLDSGPIQAPIPAMYHRPDQLQGGGKSPGLGYPWWVLPAGRISARRIAGWRVRIDLVGALELSVDVAAGGSRFGVTYLRLVL